MADKSLHVMLMYIISHLGLIFFMYPGNIISSTSQGHWLPILVGILIHFIFIFIYMKGLSYFPKKDIIRIYSEVGKGTAILFIVPVFLYFSMILLITVRAYSEIITIVFLSETPLWAIMLLMISISAYIASKGVEVIFRTGLLLAILFLPIIIFIFFTSFQNVDWRYAIPFDANFGFLTKRTYYEGFFAFSGGFLFLGFVQPYLSYKRKHVLWAAAFLIPFFIFSVYVPVLTFGQATSSTTFLPYVVAVDAININWLMFDRVTMFFLLSLISFIMLFLALVSWKAIRILSHYLPSIRPVKLLIALSAAVFFSCFLIPDWKDVEKLFWWNTFLRFYVLVAIPLSIFFFGLRMKGKDSNETV
ncbi:GerAB/ArcD/ProY family transporter [Cytobacillus oceanisediminis]|uniref:Spore germination protein n=1 Tax=Cytobacillus oceanisediminis TaxID=665099 RepID=A0A562K682_9BACI|nr:GerAB/ArcD/ProY family transporter [Cytobacillus oceanisediminis]TWH90866.1 spore germination protein [Cytobacillus oceanisediminis]